MARFQQPEGRFSFVPYIDEINCTKFLTTCISDGHQKLTEVIGAEEVEGVFSIEQMERFLVDLATDLQERETRSRITGFAERAASHTTREPVREDEAIDFVSDFVGELHEREGILALMAGRRFDLLTTLATFRG